MLGLSPNFIFELPGLLMALTVHEFAHAYVAHRLGDPTPRWQGRLTLNPVAHIDPMGLIMLVFFRFGWGKSVEVNPNNFRDYRKGMLWVSLAGPVSNLLLGLATAIVLGITGRLAPHLLRNTAVMNIFWGILIYNVYLAIFNMIPVPPLDGSKVLFGILPARIAYQYYDKINSLGPLLLLLLVFTRTIPVFIGPIVNQILSVYTMIANSLL